ncbi:MAG: hypothetical protein MZV70_29005 [Desulfobacterales bacterium]|nr:hypothetical protein [Desulfobacterales bacterium]
MSKIGRIDRPVSGAERGPDRGDRPRATTSATRPSATTGSAFSPSSARSTASARSTTTSRAFSSSTSWSARAGAGTSACRPWTGSSATTARCTTRRSPRAPTRPLTTCRPRWRPRTATRRAELVPMTLEGCVVRMADTVAYIGRDIEDAIRLGLIRRAELPPDSVRGPGRHQRHHRLQAGQRHHRGTAMNRATWPSAPRCPRRSSELKQFNLERIYLNPA